MIPTSRISMKEAASLSPLDLAIRMVAVDGVSREEAARRVIALKNGREPPIRLEAQAVSSSNAVSLRDVQESPADQLVVKMAAANGVDLATAPIEVVARLQNDALLAKLRHPQVERPSLELSLQEHSWLAVETQQHISADEMRHLPLDQRNPVVLAGDKVFRVTQLLASGAPNIAGAVAKAVESMTAGKLTYADGHLRERRP